MIKPVAYFVGNLTRDPELRETKDGTKVANFDIAVNMLSGGEKVAEYFRFVAWRTTAENIGKYLVKGSKVVINATPHNRAYIDKDGNNRAVTEFTVNEIEFVSCPDVSDEKPAVEQPPKQKKQKKIIADPVDTDDLPF